MFFAFEPKKMFDNNIILECQKSKNVLYCKTKSDLAVQRQDESSICVAKAECD